MLFWSPLSAQQGRWLDLAIGFHKQPEFVECPAWGEGADGLINGGDKGLSQLVDLRGSV